MQRAHPAQAVAAHRGLAPAHGLRPREGAHDGGQNLGQNIDGVAPGALDDGDVELALALGVLLDLRLVEGGEARALQEALDRLVGGADAGAALLFPGVGLAGRQAGHLQRQAAGRGEAGRAFIDEAALHQRVGDELLQVRRGLGLHAGGNFFGKEFEKKIGHRAVKLGGREAGRSRTTDRPACRAGRSRGRGWSRRPEGAKTAPWHPTSP